MSRMRAWNNMNPTNKLIWEKTYLPRFFTKPLTRRSMLRGALLGGAGLGTIAVVGCGDDDGGANGTPTSTSAGGSPTSDVFSPKAMGHFIANVTSLISANRGYEFGIKELGGTFTEQSYGGDPQTALNQAELFGGSDVNMATAYLVSDALYDQYPVALAEQDIVYVNYANRVPWRHPLEPQFQGKFAAHMNGSFAEEAYLCCKALFERAGGAGKMLHFTGVAGDASDNARSFGVFQALEEFPDIEIVGGEPVNWDRVLAQEAAESLLPAHPDVNIIFGQNDSIATGVMAVLRAERRTDVVLGGVDGDPEFLQIMIDDPDIAVVTAAGRLDHSGVLAAVIAFDVLNGVTYHPLETFLNTDSVMVDTPEAAQAMLDLIGASPGPLPYDVRKMSRFYSGDDWEFGHLVTAADPANFDWGEQPGVNKTPMPQGFQWPDAVQQAFDAGELDTINEQFRARYKDVYGPVRDKAVFKDTVLGAFVRLGIAEGA